MIDKGEKIPFKERIEIRKVVMSDDEENCRCFRGMSEVSC